MQVFRGRKDDPSICRWFAWLSVLNIVEKWQFVEDTIINFASFCLTNDIKLYKINIQIKDPQIRLSSDHISDFCVASELYLS